MRQCVVCGSNEIVKNMNTNKISCYDCKSDKVYRECYGCGKPIKDQDLDGEKDWHQNNQVYEMPNGKMVSCWEERKFEDICNEECT